jgi:membrane protease YdiL (CAAX protease family)
LSGAGLALFLAAAATAAPDPGPFTGLLLVGALLGLLLGLCCAAAYQIIARRSRPQPLFRGPSPLILFGIQVIGVNAVSLALLSLGAPESDTPVGFLVAGIVLLVGYVLMVWIFGIQSGALGWDELGLPERPRLGKLATDLAVASGTMLVVAVVAGLAGGLLARLLGTDAPDVVPLPSSTLELAMVALGAGILVPIGEELFFRGYALTAWLRDRGERSALIRSTIFFALVHIVTLTSATFDEGVRQAVLVVAVIGPVGLALGWLFLKRGLIAAIAGHAAFNLFGILITALAQNLPPPA